MTKYRWGAGSFVWLTLLFFAWRCAEAQLAANKDLTNAPADDAQQSKSPQAPQHILPTTASGYTGKGDCDFSFLDGVVVPKVPEKLRLEIVSLDPKALHPGSSLLVTVRLVNVGANGVLVPWDTPLVKPDVDPKTGVLSWDAAEINLDFAIQGDRQSNNQLKGEAKLVAAPSRREQHLELLPGQWLDVKFKVSVECDKLHYPGCHELPADGNAELRARWYEWLSTYEDDGCKKRKGTYSFRNVYSEPVPIDYATATSTGEKQAPPSR